MIATERRWRAVTWLLVGLALVLMSAEAQRWLSPVPPEGAEPVVVRIAEQLAQNMLALEQDLVDFLLADGVGVPAVAARADEVQQRFSWAHPLFIIDPTGEVRGPAVALSRPDAEWRANSRRGRFINLLRRARSQAAIDGVLNSKPLLEGRQPTARFAANNSRSGIHVLINLEADRLWAVYRAEPSLLARLLVPGSATPPGSGGSTVRLIDPDGRVFYASRPGSETVPVTAAVPIVTAPRWAVEVLLPPVRGGRSRHMLALFSSIRWAGAALLLALAGALHWRRRAQDSELPRGGPPTADDPDERLSSIEQAPDRVVIGDAVVDFDHYRVRRGDIEDSLTDREVALLRLLISKANQVVRRDHILDVVWGYSAEVTTRTVDTFVYRLRQKIEADPQTPRHFLTVRGAGYRFEP